MILRFSSTPFSEKKIINPTTTDINPIGFIIQPNTKILPNEKKNFKSKYLLIAKHNDDAIQKKANILCNTIDVFNHLIVFTQSPLF